MRHLRVFENSDPQLLHASPDAFLAVVGHDVQIRRLDRPSEQRCDVPRSLPELTRCDSARIAKVLRVLRHDHRRNEQAAPGAFPCLREGHERRRVERVVFVKGVGVDYNLHAVSVRLRPTCCDRDRTSESLALGQIVQVEERALPEIACREVIERPDESRDAREPA